MASARYARDKIVSYLAQRDLWEMWYGSWPPVADGHAFVFPICLFPRAVHRDSGICFRVVLEMSIGIRAYFQGLSIGIRECFLGLSLRCRTFAIVMCMFVHSTMTLLELFTNGLS